MELYGRPIIALLCVLGAAALIILERTVAIVDPIPHAVVFLGIGVLTIGFFSLLIASLRQHGQHYWSMPGTYIMPVAVLALFGLGWLITIQITRADADLFLAILYAVEVLLLSITLWSNISRTNLMLGIVLVPMQAITSVIVVYGLFVAQNLISRAIPPEHHR